MNGIEFFLYCAGVGTFMLCGAAALRLLRRPKPTGTRVPETSDADPGGLMRRLHDVQETRYGAPIIRRMLRPDAVPERLRPQAVQARKSA